MRTLGLVAALLSLGLVSFACSSSSTGSTPAPTCAQLQTQIDACPQVSQPVKDLLGPFCATASAACRTCLDGTLCGVTEQCDPQCSKVDDAGGGG